MYKFLKTSWRFLFEMGTVSKYQCKGKCALTAKPDAAIIEKLEEGFIKLFESESNSLLKKHLSKDIFDSLKFKKTKFGFTLLDCIQSGLTHYDSGVGIYAPDPDAYNSFADIYDPIIEDYHAGFSKTDNHPPKDFGDGNTLVNVDPSGKFVVSVRIRCARSVEGYPFHPGLTETQYKDLEKKISLALAGLQGDLKGTYYPLCSMDPTVQQKLIDTHYLFKVGDRFLEAANGNRFWPTGRGIYYNEDKTFLVWVNEEDHVRIISMQKGGNLGAMYRRFISGVTEIEQKIPFVRHERLGTVTFCPTNLGTGIRASVHIKIPKLTKKKAKLDEFAKKYNLQVRGTTGEHTETVGGIWDVSNKQRLGLTEYDAVKTLQDGILAIIKLEKSIKEKPKRKPTWRELARRRLRRNPALKRLKWPKFLPAYLYKN